MKPRTAARNIFTTAASLLTASFALASHVFAAAAPILPDCEGYPGEVPDIDTYIVCGADSIDLSLPEVTLPASYGIQYVLHKHTPLDPNSTNIFSVNSDGVFSLEDNDQLVYYNSYPTSVVFGPTDAGNNVILSDSCTTMLPGPELVFLYSVGLEAALTCNNDNGEVYFTFSLYGGLPSYDPTQQYTVSGTYNGMADLLSPIELGPFPLGSKYTFFVDDGSGCTILPFESDYFDCLISYNCHSDPGGPVPASLFACEGGKFETSFSGAPPYELHARQYLLHYNPNEPVGSLFNVVQGPTIDTSDIPFFSYNSTYYLTAANGPPDYNGNVLLGSPCTNFSTPAAVTFTEPLDVLPYTICNPESNQADVFVEITGGLRAYNGTELYEVSKNGQAPVLFNFNYIYVGQYAEGETYSVEISEANSDCSIQVNGVAVCTTGLGGGPGLPEPAMLRASVRPNRVQVHWLGPKQPSEPQLKVFDAWGRLIFDKAVAGRNGTFEATTGHWAAGVYFATLFDGGQRLAACKFVR